MSEEDAGLIPVSDHELFQATTARGFEPGLLIFNRFVLTRVLGRGGMGIVWLAYDQQLEQNVAIKVLPDVVMHDKEAITDMKRETKRSLQLNHHNIVRIYDFNQDERCAGISMEYVEGETLSTAKAESANGCFDVEQLGPWLEQLCDALAYAHQTAKIVHRDLKPANIMLNRNHTIKVTDFGIARSISDSVSRVSMRHASSGTMAYMSPQQSNGARSSSLDDIYALGATIYDLLTGKPPFYSGNLQHQLENIVPPRMAERRAELERTGSPIPEAWELAVAACLQKEAARRPQTVQQLAEMLGLRATATALPPLRPVESAPAEYERTLVETPLSTLERTAAPAAKGPAAPVPPPLSGPGFFDRYKSTAMILAGCVAGLALLAGAYFVFGDNYGTVAIATTPPGATATVGDQKKTTPATFDHVKTGSAMVSLALPGYDPLQVPAQVTKNENTDLGVTPLKRSTGLVAVTVIPKTANCTLNLVQSDVAGEPGGRAATFAGANAWQSSPLPTGKYQIVASAAGLPDATQDLEVGPGSTQQIAVDLIKAAAIHLLSPDEADAVGAGGALPDQLKSDPAAKARLSGYYQKTYQGYLDAGEYDLAQGQLRQLSDLGVDISSEQKRVDDARLVALDGQGTLAVKTIPPGATVSLGGATKVTPAVFEKVLAAVQTVDIRLTGYDPVQMPATIRRDDLTDLGSVPLTRETGSLQISSVPRDAACSLRLVQSDAASEAPGAIANFTGAAPYANASLGTGSYAVTATGDGFPCATQPIELKKGDHLAVTVDLVKLNARSLLGADQAAVVATDQPVPDALKQDPAAKAALAAYYEKTFQDYLRLKEFKLAETQLHHLTGDLGVTSADDQKQLDALQTEWITTETANIKQLLAQEKFDEADARLKGMETHGPQPDLRAEVDKAKADHEAFVTTTLAGIDAQTGAGNQAGAYQAAVDAAAKDPLEPRFALRVATIELAMPSTYDRVSNRVKALAALDATDPAIDQNADYTRLVGIFQRNLQRHEALRAQMDEARRALNSYGPRIAALRADAKQNEQKAQGYRTLGIFGIAGAGGAASQNNGIGTLFGLGAAHTGQSGANAREGDVRSDNARIQELEQAQASAQAQLDGLRSQYDALQAMPIGSVQ